MSAIGIIRTAIGSGDRLVPGTMSQEEAEALAALRLLASLADRVAELRYAPSTGDGDVLVAAKDFQAMQVALAAVRAGPTA